MTTMQDIKRSATRMATYVAFISLSLIMIYIVSSSWSPEALFLHPLLMPLYFAATTLLLLIIFSDRVRFSTGDKLAFTITHSFLTRIVCLIFFFPGTSGDNAYHLAHERTFDIFGQYYAALEFQIPGLSYLPHIQSVTSRLFLYQRASIQYGLVTALSKTLYIDVSWIHLFLIGTLWSFFVPLIGFKISETLGASNRAGLLTGFLAANAPMVIGWSTGGVPNSLGFFFFFVTIYFLLKSLSSKNVLKYVFLTLLALVVSLLTHGLTAIATFIVVLLAASVKKYQSWKENHQKRASFFLVFSFFVCVILLPAASVLMYLVYPTYSSFSLQKILGLNINYVVLANYASYSTIENLMYGTITFLGIIGMVLHSRKGKRKSLGLFMILALVLIIAEYRIHLYFATRELFGTGRFLSFEPFITVPFAAIAIEYLINTAKPVMPTSLNPAHAHSSKRGILSKLNFPSKQTLIAILMCLGLSALIVEGALTLFQGLGFGREPYGILSVYSQEAATLIHEEYRRTGEKYAVVSDFVSETAGMSVVGRSNPDEYYHYGPLNGAFFSELLLELSIEPLVAASGYNDAQQVYVILSRYSVIRRLGPTADVDRLINSLSRLLRPPLAVVGEGWRQVYVFSFRPKSAQGTGPKVTVYKDLQETHLNTTYSYWTLEDVEYTLNLTGATTYKVTGWPKHWSYEAISPGPTNASIDANVWINLTGKPDGTYMIKWIANDIYSDVVWKDDSFLEGWNLNTARGNYSFSSNGDVAVQTIGGQPAGFVYHAKALPLLQGSLSFQMRVKGASNSYFYVLLWTIKEGSSQIVFNSLRKLAPSDFKTYTFALPTDVVFSQIWLSSYTGDGSPSVIQWDYVAFVQGQFG